MKNPIAHILPSLIFLAMAAPSPAAAQVTVEIVNQSGVASDKVYALLTGNAISAQGITPNKSTKLSALTDSKFSLTAVSAGRITFSYDGAVPEDQDPNTPSARFDKVELSYPAGAANLTAVDFFGIPFTLETLDSNQNVLQRLTYYTSTKTLVAALLVLVPNAEITTNGKTGAHFARVLSPVKLPAAYPSMQPYVSSVAGRSLTIDGTYVGPVAPSPSTYDYTGTLANDGTITLTGTIDPPPNPANQPLKINGSSLASAIYTDNGPYTVGGKPAQVSDNDVYAAIYRDLVAGFDFGFVDGKYGSDSAGWYGTTPYHPPYACARTADDNFFNQYASLIAADSDAYGFPFADRLGNVQVSLNSAVATLRITILPDDALDAPMISSTSSTASSITLGWTAVSSATDYKVGVSPPAAGQTFDAGTATKYTIHNLQPGTPYTVSATASNTTETSAALPVVVSTSGKVTPITGTVTWNFVRISPARFTATKSPSTA